MVEVDSSKYRQGLSDKAGRHKRLRTKVVNTISQFLVFVA